jgi:uncharacterized damage-inducible protein DinB
MTTATTSALAAPTAMIFSFNEPFAYQALSGLTDDELRRAPSDRNNDMLWPGTKTVADELAFFAFHDSYHVGQLSYIRKSLGYPGLAG